MSKCESCGTEFKFSDMLMAVNPASVKCSGCPERIKSSYGVLVVAVVMFLVLMAGILLMPLEGDNSGAVILVALGVLGFAFEYGYFYLLNKKIIKSNLS